MRFAIALVLTSAAAIGQSTPQATTDRFFERAGGLTSSLRSVRLHPDLAKAAAGLGDRLAAAGFAMSSPQPGTEMRVGAKMIPLAGVSWWKRFEDPAARAWVDVIELRDDSAANQLKEQWRQTHTGSTYGDAFVFITARAENGLDAVGAVVVRARSVINAGVGLPFRAKLWESPGNSPEELSAVNQAADRLAAMLEITIAALKDPAYLTWVPPASPTAEQVRMRRVASFARLWSEIKYNFVFLHERKDVDWDSMLEQFLPRVMAAESSEQYVETLKEAVALLADGHTSVQGGAVVDRPPVRIEPVGGRPVLTAFADVPELQGVPLQRGMELLSVDGEPVDSLRRRLARTVAASTPQSRARTVDWMLLQGPLNSTATAVFRATDGSVVSAQLKRNQTSIPAKALPWRKGSFEYRELPGGIAYVALNSFGNDSAVKGFDEHFDRILQSSGLIIDVRENGGGSSGHGYSVVARLIEKGVKLKTTAWRTRNYKPALRAWGQPEEWHEGTHGEIEARGETPYRGPVMVLIGPDTFSAAEDFLAPLKISKRATLIGTPTGGSTGQPLFVPLFQASARICTKWDRFADGTEFVGLGVQPDVVVETTRADIALGRDPVLAKAQELLAAGTR